MPAEKTRSFCPCSRVLNRSSKGLKTQHTTEHSKGLLTERQHQETSKPSFSSKNICFDAKLRKYCETHTKQKRSKSSDLSHTKKFFIQKYGGRCYRVSYKEGLHDNLQSFSCMTVLFYEWDITLCTHPS